MTFFSHARSLGVAVVLSAATLGFAQTTVTGSALAMRSTGAVAGTAVTLSENGYLGTYVTLATPGPISFSFSASGVTSNGIASNMTVSVADYSQSFAVGSATASTYTYTSPSLPAGTYFVRTQLDNHKTLRVNNAPVTANTTLTVRDLTIGANAAVANTATDANALAAADTYIANFRKGDAGVKINGAAPGTQIHVQLKSNAFQIGTAVSGGYSSTDNQLMANPPTGSDSANFQEFINGRFNSVVGSNAGKWERNETFTNGGATSVVNMSAVDQMDAYAAAHGMSARQHNIIWGNQQPTQIKTWLIDAASATSTTKAASLAKLKTAIANRVAYVIGGTNSADGHVRSANFQQLDVLNEALQTGNYYSVLGANGIADVYKQAQAAIASAGLKTKLYLNEYNVLQNSPITVTTSATYGTQAAATYGDQYANWYRREIESINNAAVTSGATSDVVNGVGVQYYPMANGTRGPAVMQKALQTLSVGGSPISLTEFGGQTTITQSVAPQIVDETLRMMMGTPSADSMMFWGWYDDNNAATNQYGGGTVMVNKGWKNADGTWNLTPTGKRFEYLFGRGLDPTAPGANPDGSNPNPLTTDLTLTVGQDGMIHFNGFYGAYALTINGQSFDLSLIKGANNAALSINVPEPAAAAAIGAGALALFRRPFLNRGTGQ